jgi:hypothetical protein
LPSRRQDRAGTYFRRKNRTYCDQHARASTTRATGTFITIGPADDSPDWYASISLLPDGTTEVEHGDPDRDEHYRPAVTASPADIARDPTTWLSTRS